jgi:DNA ligase-1
MGGEGLIEKPILAANLRSLEDLNFSFGYYLATPKIDGIRALIPNKKLGLVSRTFKSIPNEFIRSCLSCLPVGTDGEICIDNNFKETTSKVMTITKNKCEFIYYWFDWVTDLLDTYEERIQKLQNLNIDFKYVKLLVPIKVFSIDDIVKFENKCLNNGYEGIILRSPNGLYKFGRSTLTEEYLLKFKRFEDSEAKVIGFVEKVKNQNIMQKDNFGYTYTMRSSKKSGKIKANTLGSLLVEDLKSKVQFNVGSGFNMQVRNDIWDNQNKYINKIIKYKFTNIGMDQKPRFPVFIGFRNMNDMSK